MTVKCGGDEALVLWPGLPNPAGVGLAAVICGHSTLAVAICIVLKHLDLVSSSTMY